MLKKLRQSKILKFIFKAIEFVFFTCAFIYLLFIILQKLSNNSSLMGYRTFTVVSESMAPVYTIGDVLYVKEVEGSELEVGDDITYLGISGSFKDMIITHRIVKLDDSSGDLEITTKGVANLLEDEPISSSQVYGKVVGKSVIIGFITKILRNQYGFFFLVFIPLVLIMFLEFVDVFKPDEDEE